MIVTLTPNPSLDRTLEVPTLPRGAVTRVVSERVDPGGKGINVSLALSVTGHATRAVVPLGGFEGEQLAAALTGAGIEVVAVPLAAGVRTNLSLTEPDGTVTKINAPGPTISPTELAELARTLERSLAGATWLASCGSLPPGAPDDLHARVVATARDAQVPVAIDTSGPALAAAVSAGPDLIKPNVHELAELLDRPLRGLGEVVTGAREVLDHGVTTVVVSLGADGAVLVDRDGAWHATTPPITVRSAVGAGDALVAGLLAGGGRGPDALALGVAYGVGAAQLPGTQFSPAPDRDVVSVHHVDPDRALTEPGGLR